MTAGHGSARVPQCPVTQVEIAARGLAGSTGRESFSAVTLKA